MAEKKNIEVEIAFGAYNDPINLGEIRELVAKNGHELIDSDVVTQDFDADDSYKYDVSVTRWRIETDEEFELRIKREERSSSVAKDYRRKTYMKLKEEFENE